MNLKITSGRIFPIAMLLSLAALTFWLERTTQSEGAAAGNRRHDPDYIVDNFTIKRFDPKGVLLQTVRADHMEHYPDDDSTRVDNPDMTYHGARPTRITAKTANMDSGGKTVIFNGDVKVVNKNPKGPDTQITTTTLTALPDEEIARTKAPVTITQGKTVVNGTGMESNNKTGIGVMYGRVRGTIESQQN